MPAIVKLQLSLQDFAEAIAYLDLEEKRQKQKLKQSGQNMQQVSI